MADPAFFHKRAAIICLLLQFSPQIYKGDPRTCAILSQHGAQIGCLRVFPQIKIIVLHMSLHLVQSDHEHIHALKAAQHTKNMDVFVLYLFLRVRLAKSRRPHSWQHITRGNMRGLESPLYICDFAHKLKKSLLPINSISGFIKKIFPLHIQLRSSQIKSRVIPVTNVHDGHTVKAMCHYKE